MERPTLEALGSREILDRALDKFAQVLDKYQEATVGEFFGRKIPLLREKVETIRLLADQVDTELLRPDFESALLRAEVASEEDPLDIEEMILGYPFVLEEIMIESQQQ